MKQATRGSFYGRTEQLAELSRVLGEPGAVVTLTGPPGSGKSRLAREHADASDAHPGGVHWIDLADARTTLEMCGALAAALGEQLPAEPAGDAMVRRLSGALAARGEALFVLDDLEQLGDVAPRAIETWRAEADAATFLITSRECLRIAGERRLDVGPLPVPDEGERDTKQIARVDSVRLFVDRARAVRSGYAPAGDELVDVATLVRALDGIPLAIELCAARAALLGTRQIIERLPAVLDLPAQRGRGAPARHATVRAAIDSSWELLAEDERSALALCAVFRGGFGLDAAERVVGAAAIDRMQSLVDKSLVHVFEVPGLRGELRFGMYEPVARYAAEQLDRSGERAAAETRHAAHFADVGFAWATAVDERDGGTSFRRLLAEQPNLLAAVQHISSRASDPAQQEQALRLALALEPGLRSRGPLDRLTRLLDDALDRAAGASPTLVARARVARGVARYIGGDVASSAADFEAAATTAPSPELEALARVHLAVARASAGDLAAARRELDLGAGLAAAAGAPRIEALARTHRARWVLAREGSLDEARRELEGALVLLHRSGGIRDESRVCAYLGHLAFERGAAGDARSSYERAASLLRELGDRRLEAELLIGMAAVEQELGCLGEAHARLADARAVLQVIGVDDYLGVIELHLGGLALDENRFEEAAEHHAAAAALLVAPRSAGLAAVAIAGRAIADARRGRAAEGFSGMAHARTLADAASPGVARTVELLAAALDVFAGGEGADARAEDVERAAASERPAFAEPLQEEVRVYRFARRLLAAARRASGAPTSTPRPGAPSLRGAWLVREDGRAFRPPRGAPVSLDRRGTLNRILRTLAERREAAPGDALGISDLAEAGWPGQRIGAEALANRVRVALSALRKLGLRDLLLSRDDGYLLDPTVPVAIVPDTSSPR